jgi:hypothetical protein
LESTVGSLSQVVVNRQADGKKGKTGKGEEGDEAKTKSLVVII